MTDQRDQRPEQPAERHAAPDSTAEVIVVGAGPTGLLLAGDLATAGVAVTVLERRGKESNLTRAFAVHARTLEQLDARGLADELLGTGTQLAQLRFFGRLRLDLSRLPTRFPFMLITPQSQTERLLLERAVKAGAVLLREHQVTGLRQDGDGVTVTSTTPQGQVKHRARYLVGADGVHSSVRELAGIPFPGESVVSSVLLADVRLEHAPQDALTMRATEDGFGFVAPFGDGWYRVVAWDRTRQLSDDAPVELAEVADIARRTLGVDYGLHDARWMSRFHSDERQVPHYRDGRVLLAGDAAHCHSPAGGQGMNTGLQDAANLSWKLAAVLRGRAPESLLDTYQTERHPVGKAVLRSSGALMRLGLARSAASRAARTVATSLATSFDPLITRAARTVSGIGISYPAAPGSHPLAGRRMPDLRLAQDAPGQPGRLYEALRAGMFVLITTDERAPGGAPFGGLEPAVSAPWADRLVHAAPADPHGKLRSTVLLVRPDGYAAWAAADPSRAELRAALTHWLGEPGAAAGA
ncbi:2-polyprenyl-6-methoxyphenol hydroxylase-like FAD-dependent oxidoreductase [Kitasatospora sp. GAS204A]|uniref:FAD-dependent monooxygenase n=1 Tax=unclassified Kitasatospora TaxID=2633591 RepID=UPI0024753E3B|nr:FAD-dependent monooxygenase [Kitasatospora sp. GAS204B]MDH6119612.1 2-polyprenyl-6-methoxyphenol hydroxylase-like FAD-dependent oxidoreductase [Kitasatospora sp. GAS204B]